jgi:hypothetical protein
MIDAKLQHFLALQDISRANISATFDANLRVFADGVRNDGQGVDDGL